MQGKIREKWRKERKGKRERKVTFSSGNFVIPRRMILGTPPTSGSGNPSFSLFVILSFTPHHHGAGAGERSIFISFSLPYSIFLVICHLECNERSSLFPSLHLQTYHLITLSPISHLSTFQLFNLLTIFSPPLLHPPFPQILIYSSTHQPIILSTILLLYFVILRHRRRIQYLATN